MESMKASLEYIEAHLTEKIAIKDVAKVASYSPFHFQRVFQMTTKTTFGDYIRNRRLTLAAIDIINSDDKIIDIAYKYQYDSPEGFLRAFKKLFGVTPSRVRKEDVVLKSYPKLELAYEEGFKPLDYHVVKKDMFYISGYKRSFTAHDIIHGSAYSEFWSEKKEELVSLIGDGVRVGAGSYKKDNQNIYDAIIGTFGKKKNMDVLRVESCKWCIFKGKGPVKVTLPKLWERIFLEWFPKTSFQHSGKTELELFPVGDLEADDYVYEIWIPLDEK